MQAALLCCEQMAALSAFELQSIDDFLASSKRLDGAPPPWVKTERAHDFQATWNVIDHQGATSAYLRFRLSSLAPEFPSVTLVYRGNGISRLDLCSPALRKYNPLWAEQLGLPGTFQGSHCHGWTHNRDHVGRTGLWKLDAKEPVGPSLRRVPQMLPWFTHKVGIRLTPEQRQFDAPEKTDLFEGF